jgi:DNA primase
MRRIMYAPESVTRNFGLHGKGDTPPIIREAQLRACCPFPHYTNGVSHYETNPSFGINLLTGQYNCFSCGASGPSLSHLAFELNVPYDGIDYQFSDLFAEEEKYSLPQDYLYLLSSNQDHAINYLRSRNIENADQIAVRYNIGSSADGSAVYLPIVNERDVLMAWSERKVSEDGAYRWYFLPEEAPKKELVFGINNAKHLNHVILVESPIDALILVSWGYNAVATLGAKVSYHQLSVVVQFFDRVTIVMQNDQAGIEWRGRCKKYLSPRVLLTEKTLPYDFNDIGDGVTKEIYDNLKETLVL